MKLKRAILETLSRDELKRICGDLEIGEVDLRSAEAMAAKLSRARRATAEVLFEYLGEPSVKMVADKMGMSAQGRRGNLIDSMLAAEKREEAQEAEPLALKATEGNAKAAAAGGGTPRDGGRPRRQGNEDQTEQYRHSNHAVQRPDVGVQDQFQAKKPPKTYRYDSSLDPALSWDENRDRDLGEWLLGLVERAAKEGEKAVFCAPQEWKGGGIKIESIQDAVACLKRLSKPFLNWAGKAERHEISIPTVPLFVHERHSTKAILDGVQHRKAKGLSLDLFGDPSMDMRDRLEAYEHKGPWQNRMILGDSLQVMNSMLEYEGLGGQVQMIYLDPPYGVKFGSNFQPFIRRRDVKDSADGDLTREPEMVKAYRDTWELGLHSYLTYLRDRLLTVRELLHESGSVFVQISDENVHLVRCVLDEVFGSDNFISLIAFTKTSGLEAADRLAGRYDLIVWYAKHSHQVKYRAQWAKKSASLGGFTSVRLADGTERTLLAEEAAGIADVPDGARVFRLSDLTKPGPGSKYVVEFEGKKYEPGARWWGTTPEGMARLIAENRIRVTGKTIKYLRYLDDFPLAAQANIWTDTGIGYGSDKLYVVQTHARVIERCTLMTTDPGDLVLDPTCGSGTTAYVAEQWGRRWITCDTSRVPLALARQRLLTATFPYYQLKTPKQGPSGGFVYQRKQNRKGEQIGGLVPHITLKSIANDEPPAMEVLVDRPEELDGVTRVSGPFVVEATIAPVQPLEWGGAVSVAATDPATHVDRMTEVLRQSRTLQMPGNRSLTLSGIRRTSDTEYLHAEATEGNNRIAVVFGPADGSISQSLVYESAREAHFLKYDRLYFFGFAIESAARQMIEEDKKLRIPSVYVSVTPDVAMSDLLKTSRASQIFSVTGLPDFALRPTKKKGSDGQLLYEVELEGLDIFDPESLETESVSGQDVPCWMLDSDYDGMSFYATQVFFPKTSAWDNLQKSLKATFDESVWTHLSGTVSEPFVLGERRRVAVKVIDERGNELMRVKEIRMDGGRG